MSSTSSVLRTQTSTQSVGAYDRLFYSSMAILLALAVFAGFARTYYLPLFAGGPTATIAGLPFTPLVHVHGALFTAWALLFVVQTTLIAQRRVAIHRGIGVAGAVLASAMFLAGGAIRIWEARLLGGLDMTASLPMLVLGMNDMLLFAAFVTAAIVWRRNKEAHKRLMLLAYVCLLDAAVARIPGLPGRHADYVLTLLPIAAGMTYDLLTRGRVHPVYLWGGMTFVIIFTALKFL
jgi:hypothetical protein